MTVADSRGNRGWQGMAVEASRGRGLTNGARAGLPSSG